MSWLTALRSGYGVLRRLGFREFAMITRLALTKTMARDFNLNSFSLSRRDCSWLRV